MDSDSTLGFILYSLGSIAVCIYFIYKVAPRYGQTNVFVYVTVASLIGSLSVMACKGLGIAVKLTVAGVSQLREPSTYFFAVAIAVGGLTQMHYLNAALASFSTALVTPVYYVYFTTATILASLLLFQGVGVESEAVDIVTMLCGFLTTIVGVFLLKQGRGRQSVEGLRALVDPLPMSMYYPTRVVDNLTRPPNAASVKDAGGYQSLGSPSPSVDMTEHFAYSRV